MKLSCLQENLAKGLSVVGRAVASRSTLPVLSNILLATDASRLKLSATDLEIGIHCWVGADVQEEGSITVPARLLTELVSSLPTGPINLELITRTHTLNLTSQRFEANIKGIDAQEFPLILLPEEEARIKLEPETLHEMIDQVAFAAAQDQTRPVLTGVLAEMEADKLTLAAADSYRLSVRSLAIEDGPETKTSVIIPARALQELRRISSDEQKPIDMLVAPNRSQVFFHMPNVDLVSQLVEGNFPAYRQIIPASHTTTTTMQTSELLKAVRTAFVFARDSANIVRIQVVPNGDNVGRVIVSATSSEHGDNVVELDATIDGEPIEIAFNARYLIDVLSVISTAQVSLETRDVSSPGVIRPVADGGDFLHIIMPMHIAR